MSSRNFYTFAQFALLILSLCKSTVPTQFTHDRKRVGPVNLVLAEHDCLKTFTVSENTIIMTQDSRLLGAKFLNESDVSNREDCLSFCCNTRFCDVAVFQEKSPFSCYLFDCGTPENLVCKFTTHSYYTSAVLTVNRHQLDLGLWSSQYQREAELTDLRSQETSKGDSSLTGPKLEVIPSTPKAGTEPPPTTAPRTTTAATTSAPTTPPRRTSVRPASKPQNLGKCSTFQFECHSGECIAVYNACDGIAQCRDGSDEAAELACPQTSDTYGRHSNGLEANPYANDVSLDYPREDGVGYGLRPKNPVYFDYNHRGAQPSKYNIGHQDVMGEASSLYHHEYPDYGGGFLSRPRELHQLVLPPQTLRQQEVSPVKAGQQIQPFSLRNQPVQIYQHQPQRDNNKELVWQRPSQRYRSYQTETQQNSRYGEAVHDQPPQGYLLGRKATNVQPLRTSLLDNSRGQEFGIAPNQDTISRQYPDLKDSQHPAGVTLIPPRMSHPLENSQRPIPRNDGITNTAETSLVSLSKGGVAPPPPSRTNPDFPPPGGHRPEALNASHAHDPVEIRQEATKASGTQDSAKRKAGVEARAKGGPVVAHSSISHLAVNIAELKMEEEDQKLQTSGAILALSLGMCITALLIVLVGCRLKGVKRRVRRRRGLRSPLKHDADYLVNGMYL